MDIFLKNINLNITELYYLSLQSSHFLQVKFINQRINKNKYPNIIGNKNIDITKIPIPLKRLTIHDINLI